MNPITYWFAVQYWPSLERRVLLPPCTTPPNSENGKSPPAKRGMNFRRSRLSSKRPRSVRTGRRDNAEPLLRTATTLPRNRARSHGSLQNASPRRTGKRVPPRRRFVSRPQLGNGSIRRLRGRGRNGNPSKITARVRGLAPRARRRSPDENRTGPAPERTRCPDQRAPFGKGQPPFALLKSTRGRNPHRRESARGDDERWQIIQPARLNGRIPAFPWFTFLLHVHARLRGRTGFSFLPSERSPALAVKL
jgi:hypothetical protein